QGAPADRGDRGRDQSEAGAGTAVARLRVPAEDRGSRAAAEDDRSAGDPLVRRHLTHLDAQVARHRGDPRARQVPEHQGDRGGTGRESDADYPRRKKLGNPMLLLKLLMVPQFFIAYVILALIVALLGRNKAIGFW